MPPFARAFLRWALALGAVAEAFQGPGGLGRARRAGPASRAAAVAEATGTEGLDAASSGGSPPVVAEATGGGEAPSPSPSGGVGAAPMAGGRKSALVFGFFAAKEKELAFIRKQYLRRGFDDVVVEPSLIASLARPSGWYRVFKENARRGADHHLARHFDVVHCMSGGFLHLYLTRGAGVPLECDTLLLDSTPILPKPAAFVTFARQFIRDAAPAGGLVALFPRALHLAVVRARWSLTAVRLRLQHRLGRALAQSTAPQRHQPDAAASRTPGALVTAWLRMSSAAAISGGALVSYDQISKHAERVCFGAAPRAKPPKRTVFLHNPNDPYLSNADVQATLHNARALGMPTTVAEVATDHVQTIFRKPALLFDALEAA